MMNLTPEQVEQYRDEGYLVLNAVIPPDKVARYRAIFDELVERSRSLSESQDGYNLAPDDQGRPIPGRLHKLQGVCIAEPRVLGLAREPELLDRVESLIGPNIDVFGTKFYPMLVRGATSTGWHQDNHYFGTNSDRVLSCAIYLEETTRENGCLQVVPRSHRTGDLVEHESGAGIYTHGSWTDVDESQAVDVICPPGTAVFFSANLLHGARPNLSDRTSYRTAWHYIPGDLDLAMFPRGGYEDRHILRGS
jgi:phytanoyl-CoA hydroxylase